MRIFKSNDNFSLPPYARGRRSLGQGAGALFGSAGRWCRFSAFDQRSTIRLIADRGGRWPDHAILRVDNLFDRGPPRSNTSGSIPSFSDNSRIFLVSPSVLRSVNGLVYVDVLLHGESRSIQ